MAPPLARNSRGLVRIPATKNIKILLAIHGMTQVELADALGVGSQSNLNALISGRRVVSAHHEGAQRISEYFGQSIDALFPLVDLAAVAEAAASPLDLPEEV